MDEYENYDEGYYCENCDRSYPEFDTRQIGEWHMIYVCPSCDWAYPRVYHNDTYFELGLYLLSIADKDNVWPDFALPLPMYES